MKKVMLTALFGAVALSACTQSDDIVLTQFNRETGAIVDAGSFGNSTANNLLVHTSEPNSFVFNLANRFAEEVTPTINFEFNSSTLDAAAQATLREQAEWIRQFPEIRFRVYGHTDLVGSNAYNQRLGQLRANAAVAYLVSQGVDRQRLEAVASFGETQPLVVTEDRERRNRRTVTEVTGFVKTHRNVLDGRYAQIVYRDYIASAVAESQLSSVQSGEFAGGN